MKLKPSHLRLAVGTVGLTLGLAACSKKKSDDSDDGETKPVNDVDGVVLAGTLQLQLSDSINIIPAKTEGAALALADVDDAKAKVNYRVQELSTKGLDQVQGIMCFLAQTHYAEMANKGPYVALVNESKCFKDGDSNKGVQITRVKIESVREEGKALVVKLWMAGKDEGEEGMQVVLQVAEGSSATNPVGIFRLQFGHGYIESRRDDAGNLEVVFLEDQQREGEVFSTKLAVRLEVSADGQIVGGHMNTESNEQYGDQARSSAFKVAFNDNFINRTGTSNDKAADACIDRNQFTSRAWNYNVYKEDGSLLTMKSGFPIEWTEGGATKQGYASYWGVSGQNGSGLPASVTSVNRVEYTGGEKVSTPLTVKSAPGKLYKKVKKTITLGELTGAELRQYTMNGSVIAKWNGTKFVKVATVTFGNNGEVRTPASGDVAADDWSNGYRFQVDSLGGEIFIPEGSTSSFEVNYFQRSLVSGTDEVPTTELVCFDRCMLMEPTAEKFQQQGWGQDGSGPFKTVTVNSQDTKTAENLTTAIETYTWDGASHNLKVGTKSFTLPSGLSGESQNMHQTGALVPKATWTAITNKSVSPYDLERLVDVYYVFETGSQSWNQFTALMDADGKVVQFDQPVNFTYVHSKENDLNRAESSEYYGQTFSLQYGGAGNLWGFPNAKDEDTGYYVSKFSLAPGATLEGGYVAVPVEVEQVLTEVDVAQCADIPLDSVPEMPSTPPAAVDNGEEPSDDTPVKVNNGELVDE